MTEHDFRKRISFILEEDIVDINLDGVDFTTSQESYAFHDVLDQMVSDTGRNWFFLSCFTNCTITPEAALHFSTRRFYTHSSFSRGAVRHGASPELDRAMKSLGSNPKAVTESFNSREEALAKIEEMKSEEAW